MNILIVEDESMSAKMLHDSLVKILGDQITSLSIVSTLTAAKLHIRERPVDLLFLDLDLNNEDGFEIFKEILCGTFQTIIVSANTHKALQAFEHSVLDFVPKPYSENRLTLALERYANKEQWSTENQSLSAIGDNNAIIPISIKDIYFFVSEKNNTLIHLTESSFPCRKQLSDLEKILPNNFLRTHRSHIINLTFLGEVQVKSGGAYTAVLTNGVSLPIGRTYYSKVKQIFQITGTTQLSSDNTKPL